MSVQNLDAMIAQLAALKKEQDHAAEVKDAELREAAKTAEAQRQSALAAWSALNARIHNGIAVFNQKAEAAGIGLTLHDDGRELPTRAAAIRTIRFDAKSKNVYEHNSVRMVVYLEGTTTFFYQTPNATGGQTNQTKDEFETAKITDADVEGVIAKLLANSIR